ncbi:FKBP-type peptidyl-prolyl cis-trans isomerase [Flocculibacter collagenilyticus]|uniref:FKBP-type peptidyl-prolyl cis-trans isomerase n=1 Tax=Flocculibacter collagenilyticus TaxID=2744479 RepID=UPI0018F766EF|nr:FKBP-type peptidyl-prolyl cis-trans isomerase [Flocculibacter collagenilyticus]
MRTSFKLSLLATALVALTACNQQKAEPEAAKLETEEQKQAYSIGASVGSYVKNQLDVHNDLGIKLESDLVVQGMKDALAGKEQITADEAKAILMALDASMREKKAAKDAEDSKLNIEKGQNFLAENAKKEGVVTLESGLQYQVLKEGEGPKPAATDTVKVHYHGTLLDGTVFDSSYDRGEPAVFPLNRVIKGWTEGVQLMKEGAKYKFFIPSELAYGERATGKITPNSTLVFDVELLEVQGANSSEGASE